MELLSSAMPDHPCDIIHHWLDSGQRLLVHSIITDLITQVRRRKFAQGRATGHGLPREIPPGTRFGLGGTVSRGHETVPCYRTLIISA